MSESLAAHLYIAHQRAHGDSDDKPLSAASPRLQRQYRQFAAELEKLTAPVRAELAEHRPSDRRRVRLQNETVQWLRRELAAAEAERDRLAEQARVLAETLEARAAKTVHADPYEHGQAIGLRTAAVGIRQVLDGDDRKGGAA